MRRLNDKMRSVKQLSENVGQSAGQFTTKAVGVSTNKLNEIGQTVRKKVVDTTVKVRSKVNIVSDKTKEQLPEVISETLEKAQIFVSTTKEKLTDFNIKNTEWVVRAQVVGDLTSAVPLLLKDLPSVAKSLANRAGGVTPDKLFDKIPTGVKLTEENILEFLKIHEVSHRISIKNNPNKAGNSNNVIFENSQVNRARGSNNMTRVAYQNAKSKNAITNMKFGVKAAVGAAMRGALLAALLEFPITCFENVKHVKNNRKSYKEAFIDAVKDVSKNALGGGAVAGALTGLSLLGVTLGPAAIPLAIVGGAVYTWSATDRVWKALDDNTKEKLLNSEPVLFLASVIKCQEGQDCVSSLEMLTESEFAQIEQKRNIFYLKSSYFGVFNSLVKGVLNLLRKSYQLIKFKLRNLWFRQI